MRVAELKKPKNHLTNTQPICRECRNQRGKPPTSCLRDKSGNKSAKRIRTCVGLNSLHDNSPSTGETLRSCRLTAPVQILASESSGPTLVVAFLSVLA